MLTYEPLSFETAGSGPRVDWESGFRLDDVKIASGLGTTLSPRLSDLLDIAMAAYVTDRLCARRLPHGRSGESWSRRLRVRLSVRDAAFWRRSDVSSALLDLLGWLTDDEWEIQFLSERQQHRFAETQPPLFAGALDRDARFGLFSGGLDSFLGAAKDAGDGRELILVSAATSHSMRALQRRTLAALQAASPARLRGLLIPVGLRQRTISDLLGKREAPEASQRSRGLVFIVLGAVSAVSGGADELRVYENGVGAMNLPLTEAQYGSQNTRAMRPETLVQAGHLVSAVAERDFRIVNPSFGSTKAGMCATISDGLREAVNLTVSCDTGLTHRASPIRLCGTCTSCLLRRQAMRAGGLVDEDDAERERYRVDVLELTDVSDRRLRRLHYMLHQAAQFDRALAASEPERALASAFPDLRRIWAALREQGYAQPESVTRELLERYGNEWRRFGHPMTGRYLPDPSRQTVLA